MSRNAIGHRDDGKVPRDSVVVLDETPSHRGSFRTNLQVPVLRLKSLKFSRNLHSVDTVLRLRCAWIAMNKTLNFGYKSDKRRNTDCCT